MSCLWLVLRRHQTVTPDQQVQPCAQDETVHCKQTQHLHTHTYTTHTFVHNKFQGCCIIKMYISLLGYFCDADLSPEVRFCLVHYAFVCLVILVSEEDVPLSLCESVWIHSKSMVLSSDVAAACSLVCAWLVVTTVTISNEKCKYIYIMYRCFC